MVEVIRYIQATQGKLEIPILTTQIALSSLSPKWTTITMVVDTGADICLIPRSLLSKLDNTIRANSFQKVVAGYEDNVKTRYGVWLAMKIGDCGPYRVEAVTYSGNEALIGRSVLNNLLLELDGPNLEGKISTC